MARPDICVDLRTVAAETGSYRTEAVCDEAADTIEALRLQVAALEASRARLVVIIQDTQRNLRDLLETMGGSAPDVPMREIPTVTTGRTSVGPRRNPPPPAADVGGLTRDK